MTNLQPILPSTFGEFIKAKRIALGFTLRTFCQKYDYDPGNISKMERNLLSSSLEEEKLYGLAAALKITKGTEDWVTYKDLAYVAKGAIPEDIMDHQKETPYLPLLFRTVRGNKLNKKKLDDLIKLINES
jgi:transcriptional regulator with XRE-family HTH domain